MPSAEYMREWRARNRERAREIANKATARYRERFPERYRARNAVSNAIRDGRLEREPCLFCDAEPAQPHHHDYGAPLNVTWLCPKHHRLAHK